MESHNLQSILQTYYLEHPGYPGEAQVSGFSHIQAGWESDIYSFDLIDGEPEPLELILRIYPGADALEKSEREFRNLNLLAQADFPVPKAYILERENSPFGNPFIIIERIPGKMLWQILFSIPGEQQQDLINSFCSLFVQLHNLEVAPFRDKGSIEMDPGSLDVITSQFSLWRNYYQQFPLPDFLPLFVWLDDNLADIPSSQPAVLHWDFHPENIILRPDGSLVAIDWTGLQVSDLRFDLAWTLMLISAYQGSRWRQPFLEAYERIAGAPIHNLEFFDVAACTRRLYSIAVSISAGAEKMGMRPGAEAAMQEQIEPTRAVYALLQDRSGIRLPLIENWFD